MSSPKASLRPTASHKLLLPLFGLLALAGCAESGPDFDDSYVPVLHYERYPITVVKGEAKVGISGKHAYLTPHQADVVARFAQQALSKSASAIHVKQPSGGGRSAPVAAEIAGVLRQNGIRNDMIVRSSYPAKADAPVLVSYVRNFAVTPACGSWNDLTATYDNLPYANFGCAQQNNIAAMAANPLDLEGPRAEAPADPMRRNTVFYQYRTGQPTAAQSEEKQQISIAAVGQGQK